MEPATSFYVSGLWRGCLGGALIALGLVGLQPIRQGLRALAKLAGRKPKRGKRRSSGQGRRG